MATPMYTGRFAPSPTGPLHFGSLLSALASYLDASANQGQWLLRIDDIDPPREQPGASDNILRTLQHYGLNWHGEVLYQSRQTGYYLELKNQLLANQQAYACDCSRKQLAEHQGHYPGFCRTGNQGDGPTAIRVLCDNQTISFMDHIQGQQDWPLEQCRGDFIIWRKDNLVAYQLAAAADDSAQKITHVVRGSDLLDSTPRQIHLQHLLEFNTPEYAHIPVALNQQGRKLSKQNLATPLPLDDPRPLIQSALEILGQSPPDDLHLNNLEDMLAWATRHWNMALITPTMTLTPATIPGDFAV